MSARVEWDSEAKQLVCIDLSLPPGQTSVTLEERVTPLFEAARLVGTVPHRVDVLVDLRDLRILAGGNWFTPMCRLNAEAPDNIGLFVVVGFQAPSLLIKIINAIRHIQPVKADVRFVATMAEAHALLNDDCRQP